MQTSEDPAHKDQSSKRQILQGCNHSVEAANYLVTGNVYYKWGLTLIHHIWNVKEYIRY